MYVCGYFKIRPNSNDNPIKRHMILIHFFQNLSIIIISHNKIISIKHFALRKLVNKQSIKHIFLPFYLFFVHSVRFNSFLLFLLLIYIYIYICVCVCVCVCVSVCLSVCFIYCLTGHNSTWRFSSWIFFPHHNFSKVAIFPPKFIFENHKILYYFSYNVLFSFLSDFFLFCIIITFLWWPIFSLL